MCDSYPRWSLHLCGVFLTTAAHAPLLSSPLRSTAPHLLPLLCCHCLVLCWMLWHPLREVEGTAGWSSACPLDALNHWQRSAWTDGSLSGFITFTRAQWVNNCLYIYIFYLICAPKALNIKHKVVVSQSDGQPIQSKIRLPCWLHFDLCYFILYWMHSLH